MLNYLHDPDYTYPEQATLYSEQTLKNQEKQSSIICPHEKDSQFTDNTPLYLKTKDAIYILDIGSISLLTVPYPYPQETKHRRLYNTPKCNLCIVNTFKESITPYDLQRPIDVIFTLDKTLFLPFLAKIEFSTEVSE